MTIITKNPTENRKVTRYVLQCFTGVLLVCCILVTALQVSANPDPKELFSEAQSGFEAGLKEQGEKRRLLMIKAAGQFQTLIEKYGIENGNLYYNMGNAFFEAGELGRAILAYRRAERLLPGSADLRYNLDQVRNRLDLAFPEKSWGEKVMRGILFWHYMLDYNLRRVLFFAAFVLVWIILAVMIFRRHVFLRMGLILTIAMTLGFGGSYLYSYYALNLIPAGVILNDSATVRKGPGIGYESFYQKPLPGGTEFTVREERGDWLKVRLPLGDEVWIQRSEVGII